MLPQFPALTQKRLQIPEYFRKYVPLSRKVTKMIKDTKLFTLLMNDMNMYNRTLPEILTALVLDRGILIPDSVGKSCKKLEIGKSYAISNQEEGYAFLIRRVK